MTSVSKLTDPAVSNTYFIAQAESVLSWVKLNFQFPLGLQITGKYYKVLWRVFNTDSDTPFISGL